MASEIGDDIFRELLRMEDLFIARLQAADALETRTAVLAARSQASAERLETLLNIELRVFADLMVKSIQYALDNPVPPEKA